MALTIKKVPMPADKVSIKCPYIMTPTRIVIHNTANDASAMNEIKYMQSNNNQTSFHYAVDDKEAVQGVELWRNAWHAGDGGNRDKNSKYYSYGNLEGIAIEICYSKSGGTKFDKAEKNAAELAAKLLIDFGWDMEKITKHQDYSGKYCLPIDETELLTPSGWVNLGDICVGDMVAQFDNGRIEFAPVQHVIEPYYADVIKARRIEATLNHDIVYRNERSSEWKKEKWERVLEKCISFIPVGGKYEARGLPISDDYIRYLVWVQADGHYAWRRSNYTGIVHQLGIEFHFSKKRKVDRLIEILESIDQRYSFNERSDGTYSIRIHDCNASLRTEEYLENKCFSWKFLDMNDHQREVFLRELIYADGSIQNNSYFSTKQQNYDVVSAVAALHNLRCLQTTTGNSTALAFSNSNLTVPRDTEKAMRNTLVSCVTVPSGAILIRQYGQPKVVGNCPHRTLDYGWDRFLKMVSDKRDEMLGKKKSTSNLSVVTMNGYTIERATDFSIVYWDKSKKKGTAKSYVNGGFFGFFKEGVTAFTLPVGNLVCDVTPDSRLVYAAEKYWKPYISGGKFRYSIANNVSNQFHGKKVTTLVLPRNGTPYMDEILAPPIDARYAISGIPVIRNGVDVSYNSFVKPQGWDSSPFYATSRNFIGLKGSSIWIVSGTSKSTNFVATSEVYNAVKDFGFDDLMAGDGGGSYYHKYNGKTPFMLSDRDVNNLVIFG